MASREGGDRRRHGGAVEQRRRKRERLGSKSEMEMEIDWVLKEKGLAYQRGSTRRPEQQVVAGIGGHSRLGRSRALMERSRSGGLLVQGCRGERGDSRDGLACEDRRQMAASCGGGARLLLGCRDEEKRECRRGRRRKEGMAEVCWVGPIYRLNRWSRLREKRKGKEKETNGPDLKMRILGFKINQKTFLENNLNSKDFENSQKTNRASEK